MNKLQKKTNMLREWAPLTELVNKIPSTLKRGLLGKDIRLTCVDALEEYLVLGTNVGLIFLWERKTKKLSKLPCEKTNVSIICVKIISTVDFMVAAACETGNVTIFQIPKSHSESLPANLRPKNKPPEKYIVDDLHKGPVTALEWSKNGMKLFSGDKNGLVVLTEIDFYMHICKSTEILNEAYEVVQLSYTQQRLLVSTTYRSIICQQTDKWIVTQVGKKDRKVLGNFGGLIFQKSYKVSDSCLYCSRPGLRIWSADIEGNVQNTFLFKELLNKECSEVPLINPISSKLKDLKARREASFGKLLIFDEKFLVTYNSDVMYILDINNMVVKGVVNQLRGVLDVAVYKDEIFVLEEDRSLIRLSLYPEPEQNIGARESFYNTYFPLPLPSSIKGIAEKLQSVYPDLGKPIEIHTDDTAVMYVEEATSSPVRANIYDNQEKFAKLGKEQFNDEILYKKSKRKDSNARMTQSAVSVGANSSDDSEFAPTLVNSFTGVLPERKNRESIKSDIEEKEKILEKLLELDKVEIPDISRLQKVNVPQMNGPDVSSLDEISILSGSKGENTHPATGSLSDTKDKTNIVNSTSTPSNDTTDNGSTFSETIPKTSQLSNTLNDITIHDKVPSVQLKSSSTLKGESTTTCDYETFTEDSFDEVPSCVPLPNRWVSTDIQIKDRKNSNLSESSMSDWEII